MKNVMPLWGPYSKKYFGISKICPHENEAGVRFDFTVLPAVSNTDAKVPNVTLPVGVHPWECASDYSYYSYRQELEWKDVIYADVSFTRLDDESTLVRTEIFNNSALMQNCLVNYFSSLQFPTENRVELTLPEKCDFRKANSYTVYEYATPRPWDRETMDAMHRGEFFDDRFYEHRGLGDRDNNRYILPKYPKLGEEAGDRIEYRFELENDYNDAVMAVRYRTTSDKSSGFEINGKTVSFAPCDSPMTAFVELGRLEKGTFDLTLVSKGTGGIEFDFFAVCEKSDADRIKTETVKNNFLPDIKTENDSEGATVKLKYEGIEKEFVLRTFNKDTRFREIPTGCLEDVPTARISQPDPSFDNMLETFSGEFREKHSDEGFYQNTLAHTLFIKPNESHVEYAVISSGVTEYKTTDEYEEIYINAKDKAEKFILNSAGKKYEFSNQLLKTALFMNTVYPLYHHGEYVVHHTPGKRWDSFYTWDSGFIGLAMNEYSRELAEYILDLYLSDKDNPDYAFLLHGSPVPVHIYQYYDLLCRTNDKEKLYKYYDRVKMFYDFLAGKINGSTTDKFETRLTTTFDYFYNCSGMDDLPPQAEIYRRGDQLKTAPCISSSQVIRCAKILSTVAKKLGKTDDTAEYKSDIERLSEALNKYAWDENAGYYSYVVHGDCGEFKEQLKTGNGENLNKTMDGIYPLIAGAADSDKRQRLINHIKNDMMSGVGISAVDMSASYFATNGYWNGNVWFSHQWFVWKTMLDLGESDFAFKIAETALEAWKREVEYSYYTFEMMSVTTGRGGWFHNFGGLSSPVNLWAMAYYKPGTLTAGFDCFTDRQKWSEGFDKLEAVIEHNSDSRSVILACMNENYDYAVEVNSQPAESAVREKGTIEIMLPAEKGEFILRITRR
ncbi:MAG: trehalase family glycosidase [Clostridiaceae bacterium]|nr:trehalase family glycosidase [Clostridiaceae bacterium]